ncbi:vitamin K epoxide reductase family protein [Leucobacter coleopterorum]|uniref:Vitamin K epoxide reductase family protein n=1 Tax=Leucobacter coleopterorum TaxID=2714933 RepID=A0ABX6JVN8_9MICO|nr:vitamin K epoxide reductase family protein [Leucobacter coleopterorum]QIM18369.1 vitamin K epoxide reductase family protein [Leucobacter coleopterorum]
MSSELRTESRPVGFAIFSIVAGVIGWFASFELLTEFIHKLKDPSYIPNCNVSVIVSCGPNMESWQGSAFGFTNTLLGIAAFMAPIIVGVALLAGAKFAPWFWRIYQLGMLGGVSFVFWLAYQSLFSLGTLCPWCMVVWTVTIPLFWVTLFRPYASGDIPVKTSTQQLFEKLLSWAWVIILICYIAIAFTAQLRLDWLAEFSRV